MAAPPWLRGSWTVSLGRSTEDALDKGQTRGKQSTHTWQGSGLDATAPQIRAEGSSVLSGQSAILHLADPLLDLEGECLPLQTERQTHGTTISALAIPREVFDHPLNVGSLIQNAAAASVSSAFVCRCR